MASSGPLFLPPFLCLGLVTYQPSKRHQAQFLMGPSFHDPKTPHVLESHIEQAPLSRRDGERRHAIGSYSALGLCLYFAQQKNTGQYLCGLRDVNYVILRLKHHYVV